MKPLRRHAPLDAVTRSAGRRLLFAVVVLFALCRIAVAETVTEVWRSPAGMLATPWHLAVNRADGSVWVSIGSQLVHVASDGTELWRGAFGSVWCVTANETDGSCWFYDGSVRQVVHLAEDGSELWRGADGGDRAWLSVNSNDGSCWVADTPGGQIIHLAEDGSELWRGTGYGRLASISVNTADNSCWVLDDGARIAIHLGADGSELWRGGSFAYPNGDICADPTDASVWVGDTNALVHLAADGTTLWTSPPGAIGGSPSPSVNASDGSCWTADQGHGQVVHVAPDGTELWRGSGFSGPTFARVDPTRRSVWVSDTGNGQVVRLEIAVEHGAGFAASPTTGATPLQVTFTDQSTDNPTSWAWDFGDGAASTEQDPVHTYTAAGHHTVSLSAMTDLGPDTETKQRYILALFPDVLTDQWAWRQVIACVDVHIVQGYDDGLYHPEYSVTRDQMAVYIARALATPSGDASVPPGPETATFEDVPNTGYGESGTDPYWAYKYIEYCVDQGVVQGYEGGSYAPTAVVTRDQMAVFVARAKGWVHVGDDMTTAPDLFPDVAAGYWSGTAVQACITNGVVQGYDDGKYHPEYEVTRDQMAVYVARAFALPM